MNKTTCSKCQGDGLYHAPTSRGPYCFACKGTGQVNERKARPAKVRQLSPTIRIADRIGGDPVKMQSDPNKATILAYVGISEETLNEYANLWRTGIREVAR